MIRIRVRLALSCILSLIVLASQGCASRHAISANAVDYNLAVEEAQNRMLLLNILRASERMPMYVSGISSVTGSLSTTLAAGLSLPFGGDAEDSYSASPGATYSRSPTFDVAILDSQEFMQGFLQPVSVDALAYYLEQGWPAELVLHLLVREVRLSDGGTVVRKLNNPEETDPKLEDWREFGEWVRDAVRDGIRIERVAVPIGPEFAKIGGVGDLVTAKKEGLAVEKLESGKSYELRRTQVEIHLGTQEIAAAAPLTAQHHKAPGQVAVRTPGSSAEVTLLLRSPEGILYYLGELARVTKTLDRVPMVCVSGRYAPIFVARHAEDARCAAAVRVAYRETEYLIPEALSGGAPCSVRGEPTVAPPSCDGGRSMHSLSLLSQILSLQKSSKHQPSTELVRIVGGR